MKIKDLGIRQASSTIRELASRVVRKTEPAQVIQREQTPYWQQQGWTHVGSAFTGRYQTRYGSFLGRIEQRGVGQFEFLLYQPSREIRRHSHWVCFQERSGGWHFVHMGRKAKDLSSGIMTIERLITEAYEN